MVYNFLDHEMFPVCQILSQFLTPECGARYCLCGACYRVLFLHPDDS